MRAGIAALLGAYVLSQFYRAFLAVLTPVLATDLGATASDLAAASGLWFLAFAVMQIPVGEALDRVGPRLTTAVLMAIGAAGAAIFATATTPATIKLAMVLIGVGCSSVLMASYYIFARSYSPSVFGTLAGATVGIGNLGNIGSSLPLSMAVEAVGWRASLWGLAAITALIALVILALLRDPPRAQAGQKGSLLDLLRMPALWPMLIMMAVCYAPAASIRGLWVGPLFRDVFGADAAWIGQVSLIMGLAMVAGSFAYGPLERAFGTRKWLILGGNAMALACIIGLWLSPQSPTITITLLAGLGFAGASFPMVIAHGRAFIPAHLTGRGVTLLNLFGIAPVGLLQLATGHIHATTAASHASAPYTAIFGFIALMLAAGLAVYAFSRDRTD
ncbi:MAG: MFS transporter [Pseudotabrizicola sp.]|uniref:MFS transporter n=1 Tax=Pseudotabrizicola sp. TaxID=2939647 RepID=UPI002726FF9C|nr:MFS transporter [Pseudotabrizicola sp.]MDO8883108.1 MFS transporter [Pseudotabrizicola sp.]MDP2081885.1 MFS transporter [Pseudotabrizicola sp.]MDZ7575957.1 MFS transporter [Pseudotabrizicola sp.]